ncbi:DUF4377 domain-containing protein [Rasiella sp. SM2506]|uniref:DUF4377 domain-containing protein n=1 Tax=Rasiella sp. SM2506 TaxID=3423914 RepID=UPI003D7B4F29
MKFIASILLTIIAINSCGDTKENNSKTVTYYINSTKVACEGVGKMQCLQIKKGETMPAGDWSNFYGSIEGFDYQQGYTYKLLVKEETLDPAKVPADASSMSYTLAEVLDKKQDPTFRLHDIWALQAINGKDISSETHQKPNKQPTLEIFVAEKRIAGTDGCNSLFGSIETLTETQLSFSKMGSTKMMCPSMKVPNAFTEALSNTQTYKIEKLNLYFYNAEGDEVLQFVKVD